MNVEKRRMQRMAGLDPLAEEEKKTLFFDIESFVRNVSEDELSLFLHEALDTIDIRSVGKIRKMMVEHLHKKGV